jgi:hypothetical protein
VWFTFDYQWEHFPKATNLNSSFSASNSSTKKPSHSIFNSSPLNNFQHHFLERLANLVRRGKALAEITGTLEPGRTWIPAKGRFARDAQSNLAVFNDAIVVLLVGHFLRSQAAALGRIREKKKERLGAGQS